jgi:hypothetical protein
MNSTSLRLEVGEQRGEVAWAFPAPGPEVWRRFTPSSRGDDVAQRRLAQARRAEEQHVVQRLGRRLRAAR